MSKSKYEEYRKKRQQEQSSNSNGSLSLGVSNSGRDKYIAYRSQHFASSLPERLRTLQNSKNQMYKNYNSRFVGEDGNYKNTYRGDTAAALSAFNSSRTAYESDTKKFLDELNTYEKYLDAEQVKKIKDALADNTDLDDLYKAYQTDHDYFSQWENEEAYNYSVSRAEKQKKYSKMSDDELEKELKKLKTTEKENKLVSGVGDVLGKTLSGLGINGDEAKNTTNELKNKSVDSTTDVSLVQKEISSRKLKALDSLPDDVKKLVEEYTELDAQKDETTIENIGKGFQRAFNQNTGGFTPETTVVRRKEIADALETVGVENWQELVEYNRIRKDEEKNKAFKEETKEFATEHPWISSATTILTSPTKMLGAVEMLESAVAGSGAPLNYNSPYFTGNNFVNTTRETVMENYDWEGKNTNIDWFDQIYSTAMSTGDSLLNMALTGGTKLGGAVLGATAMSDTAQEVARNGGSKEQALLTGIIAGLNEMIWENKSIGNFKALKEKGIKNLVSKKGIKTLAGNILKSVGVNASEEFNTEAANIIVDYLVNGGLSSYAQAYDAYRQGGYTETEARKKARTDMINQTVMSGVGGAMQGLLMGGAGSALGGALSKSQYNQQAKNMSPEEITALQMRATELGLKESDINVNVEAVGPWGEAGRVSEKKLSNLLSAVEDAEAESTKNELVKEARKYGIDTTQYNLKNNEGINALSSAIAETEGRIQTEVNQLSDSIYKNALKERLISLGENESTANYMAENLIRKKNGEALDSYRENSTKAKSAEIAYNELLAVGENAPQWVKDTEAQINSAGVDLIKTYTRKTTAETLENVQDTSAPESAPSTPMVEMPPVVSKAAENFAAQFETPQKQEAARRLYVPALDRNVGFKSAFDAYYNAGLKGIGSFEAIDKYYTYAHSLPLYWRKNVFSAGRENKVYNPGVNAFYQSKLTATQKNQVRIMDAIGKEFGISFIVYDNLKDNGGKLNGRRLTGTNKILVSLDAEGKLYLRTAGHECFHLIEEWNSAEAEKLTEKVIGYLKNSEGYDYSARVSEYANRYGVDANTADGLKLIHSEMAADSMFDVFSNEKFVKDLVEKNRTLAQKLKDILQNFLKQLRNMISEFKGSAEMNALREQTEALEEIRSSFHNALRVASTEMQNSLKNEQKNTASRKDITEKAENGTQNEGNRYSFAGVKAKTHDFSLFEKATRLDDIGKATSEEIRQQTGWFRGYDGKWRYEISDRDMEIDTRGKFSSNPDVRRYTELVDKVYFDMTATETETQELKFLEKNLEGVQLTPKNLGELIKHDELFAAYPQLKDLPVYFADITERGAYNPVFKEIVLQKSLKLDKTKLSEILVHEIQHAIQDIEGFASGSNTEYWRDVGIPESKLWEYYEKTAGEIEARDSAQRSWRTDKARKEKRPDIDRTDVVFADDSVVGNSIVEPFTDNEGNYYNNAVLLDTQFFNGTSPRNWGRELKKYLVGRSKNNPFILPVIDENGNVQQLQFAKIKDRVTKNGKSNHKVLDELSRTSDNISKLSVIHIDEIIEVSEENNPYFTTEHKHQWLDEKGWLHRTAYVINATNGNVHQVVMDIAKAKDGRIILFAVKGKTKKVGNVQVNSLKIKGSGQNSNFAPSLTQNSNGVNSNSMQPTSRNSKSIKITDSEYLSAVENGDMETAQKLVDEAAAKAGYKIKAYHGGDKFFTVFSKGNKTSQAPEGAYFFSSNKDVAYSYTTYKRDVNTDVNTYPVYEQLTREGTLEKNRVAHGGVYSTYLKMQNPYIVDFEGEYYSRKVKGMDINETVKYAKENGYDGVVARNIKDPGDMGDANFENEKTLVVADDYIVFDSSKIKSAELVTYDDNGEIIPLSERFKDDKKDIRYSLKMSSSAREALESNPELKLIFQNMQKQMQHSEGYIPDGKRIHQFAVKLRKDVETTLPVAELESDLQGIYKVLASIEDSEGYEYAWDLTVELAQKMLTNSRVLDDLNAEKKDLRERLTKYLKGRKFYLSPSMKAEIESYYDTYGNYHRKIFGRGFSFSENATTTLESEWNDLCAELPELFDPDTLAVEQPIALLEAFNATEWKYGLFDEYQYDSQVQYTATEIMNTLTDIPTTTTLLDRITERQYNEIASLNSENRKKIKELKQQYSEDLERMSSQAEARYKLQIKKNIEQKKATEVRRQIEKQIVRLSDMLAHGKKNRHIPLKLIDAVRDLCYSVTLNRASQTELGKNLSIIEASYAALNAGKENADGELNNQFLKNAYDKYVHELVKNLKTVLEHKSVANMTLEELIQVNETVKAVAQRVTRANELHIESRNEGVEETANAIGSELGAPKMKRAYSWDFLNKGSDKAELEAWKFLKPVYAWRMMGSETFAEIMGNIRAGEDTWAVDMYEAKEKIDALAEKYNKKTWEKGKIEVELSSGTYSFSIQQLMMLYVAKQREQYIPHLLGNPSKDSPTGRVGGGFVFEDAYKTVESKKDGTKKKPKVYRERDAGTHTLTEADLEKITETLTAEQKGYANEMRDYLARDLAVKGNEITRVLYDMNKFVEEKYFPIKVAREFLDGTTKEPEVRSVLSQSMLKDLQEKAANPILLRDFDTVWAEHVQQMAMFHSFALPLDDYQRVFNFRTTKGKATSIKTQIETACGKGAISYIENFIKDVNGGVRAQNGAELVNTMISKFKKGAVFASASVTVQQPSAIARAIAVIEPKYFTNPTLSRKDYEELMKYAPIARIKSMGFFDTNIGQSSTDWLTSEKYSTKKEKLGAFFSTQDSSYRDELLSKAPELMDEITWCNIWHAVKKETAAKTGLTGEELLKKSGKRFAEVIELTQVYDSVFSKSELMRSRDTGVKMMTAFMAEPTVSLNMLVDAAVRAKRGNLKGGGRYVGAFVASVVLNNILKALVTAPRDDDEEKTLIEKYIVKVFGGIKGDLNPLSLVPIAKDIISIFDGYSIERADMSLVQNLYDAIKDLSSDKKTGLEKGFGFANALTAFLGLPTKNITRDLKAVGNLVSGFLTIGDTSAEGIKQAVKENSSDSLWNKHIKKIIFGSSEDQLYKAIRSGDYSAYEKLHKDEYGGDSAKVNAAIRAGLIENDDRVALAAQARLDGDFYSYDKYVRDIAKDGFSNENVVKAVNNVYNKLTEDEESGEPEEKFYSLYSSEDLNNALETGGDYETVIDDMIETSKKNGSTQQGAEGAVKSRIASHWKEVYFNASAQERKDIEKLLDETGLYRDIEETTAGWVYSILKEEYIAATSTAERNRIKQEIWKSGYFSTRRKMNDSLEKLLEGEEE